MLTWYCLTDEAVPVRLEPPIRVVIMGMVAEIFEAMVTSVAICSRFTDKDCCHGHKDGKAKEYALKHLYLRMSSGFGWKKLYNDELKCIVANLKDRNRKRQSLTVTRHRKQDKVRSSGF